jgi:hypothetical protein
MNKQRYTARQVAQALIDTKGMLFIAAQRLGCDPETIRNYCKRYPTVQAVREAQRGTMLDAAELKLWQAIQNGESWAITLALKTLGKDRGYVEQQKLALTDPTGEHPAEVTVIYLPSKAPSAEEWAHEVQHLLPSPTTNGTHAEEES